MSERCGQVATAIVQSVTPRLPDLHRKITAAELVLCKTFENIFGIHQGINSAGRPLYVGGLPMLIFLRKTTNQPNPRWCVELPHV